MTVSTFNYSYAEFVEMIRFYKSGRQVIELLGAAHSFRKSGASASLSDRIFLALSEAEGWSLSEVEGPAG